MTEDEARDALPVSVMPAVLWRFADGEPAGGAAEFDRRVRRYHVDVSDEDTWEPDERVVPIPRVLVRWFGLAAPDDGEYTDFTLELAADDGAGFTAGELLRKLDRAVSPRLAGADHRLFEGLYLTDAPFVDGVPVYEMMQGS